MNDDKLFQVSPSISVLQPRKKFYFVNSIRFRIVKRGKKGHEIVHNAMSVCAE